MPKNDLVRFGKYYSLVLLLPVSMAVGYGIGYGLDRLFGTHFLRIVFVFVGFASGMIELVRELSKDDAGK
jgi:ATP synthase protein I